MQGRKQRRLSLITRVPQTSTVSLLYAFSLLLAISAGLSCLAPFKESAKASIEKAPGQESEKRMFPLTAPNQSPGKAILIFMDRVGLEDILKAKTPNIDRLVKKGSSGLMNARVRNDIYGAGNYLVIGAGGRAIAGQGAGLAFEANEVLLSRSGMRLSALNIFQSRTGLKPRRDSIVHFSIEDMKKRSESIKGGGVPGILGETLKKAAKKVSLVGNADSLLLTGSASTGTENAFGMSPEASIVGWQPDSLFSYICHREAACAAIDRKGIVPSGKVSTELVALNLQTGNASTNFDKLLSVFASKYAESDFIIVDLGETSRVDESAQLLSDKQIKRNKSEAIMKCDRAIGKIMNSCDLSRDLLILCVPTPSRKMISQTELITPVFIRGPGFERGVLTSATTRKRGLITNIDIAPTVLSFFGIEIPTEIEGKPAKNVAMPEKGRLLESLLSMKKRAVFVANSRATLFKMYIIPAIFAFLICAALSIIRKDLITGYNTFWSILFLAVLAGPAAFSFTAALPINSLWFAIPASLGTQILSGIAAYCIFIPGSRKIKDSVTRSMDSLSDEHEPENEQNNPEKTDLNDVKSDTSPERGIHGAEKFIEATESKYRYILPRAVLLISALTLLMVLIDPLIGTPFGSSSPFGALIVLGGRFYGIGNSFMGLAVGSATALATVLWPVVGKKIGAALGKTSGFPQLLIALLIFTITLLVLGHTSLGANVGGVITVGFAGIVSVFALSGRKLTWKIFLTAALIVTLILAVLIMVDMLVGGASSHAGTFVARLFGEKPGEALRILGRKMAMNYMIMLNSLWRFFVLAVIFALFIWERTFAIFKRCFSRFPVTRSTLAGMVTAFFISLIFNDTGIEPASAILLFLAAIFLLFAMPMTAKGKSSSQKTC